MKTLKEFIVESKYFKLTDGERDALCSTIGTLTGNLGDDELEKELEPLKKELSEDELKQLGELYQYVLDDDQTYPTINRNIIKDEIPVLIKVLTWMDDEGIGDFEHTDMLEKMTAK